MCPRCFPILEFYYENTRLIGKSELAGGGHAGEYLPLQELFDARMPVIQPYGSRLCAGIF
jgi:hypothetical protein